MLIERVVLRGFKPFLHTPTPSLEIDVVSPTTIIIGDNGSGKSSLLYELTPLPPVSTLYLKNGFKQLVISHNGQEYVLTSDFDNTDHTHSFKCNGKELNLSGNSRVQIDLCASEFGYTATMNRAIKVNPTITKLEKADRKILLYEICPSDLSFVLEKYKLVVSKIKAYRNNLSMLRKDQGSLNDVLIKQEELDRLEASRLELIRQHSEIERIMFVIKREITEIVSNPALSDNVQFDIETEKIRIAAIAQQASRLRAQYPSLFTENDCHVVDTTINIKFSTMTDTLAKHTQKAEELSRTLKEYEAYSKTSIEAELNRLKSTELALVSRIKDAVFSDTIPILRGEELVKFEESTYPQCKDLISTLSQYGCKLWPVSVVRNGEALLAEWVNELNRLKPYRTRVEQQYLADKAEYEKRINMTPEDCSRYCKLREGYGKGNTRVHENMLRGKQELEDIDNKIVSLERRISKLRNSLQDRSPATPFLDHLENIYTWNFWGDFVLNKRMLINCVNNDSNGLLNRMALIINNSKNAELVKELNAQLQVTRERISSIEKTNLPAEEIIQKVTIEKRAELTRLLQDIQSLQRELSKVQKLKDASAEIVSNISILETLERDLARYSKKAILTELLNLDRRGYEELEAIKNSISEKLRTLETTLASQKEIKSKLDGFIVPKIIETEKKLAACELIEPMLSPENGVQKEYMISFINKLFSAMNEIIRIIWGYGLEMEEISMDGPLDFSFSVIINEGDSVPDSWCSYGEQEMLNLAWTFALCKVLKFGQTYPIRLDEPDKGLSPGNRSRLLELISSLVSHGYLKQLFLVNHHYSLFSAFTDADVVCLNSRNITTPAEYNTHVKL